MSSFAQRIIKWQRQHGRHDLPWQSADAYHVWLSEIMLQQTQVATVLPYYQRFIATFPTIAALAAASEEQVLAHWSGLGYYARGRNLRRAAQIIMEKHHGEFPRRYEQMLELPGIGRSTAAAICALAYHERRAILDGNVKRVLARHAAIEGYSGDKKIEARLWQQAEALLPHKEVAAYTQGLMDLGALICTRSKPQCTACPAQADCAAYQHGRVAQLPTPRPRKATPGKRSTFLLLLHNGDIFLEKRASSGIWGGLWCPPQFANANAALAWCVQSGIETATAKKLPPFVHTFTHFKLHITPLLMELRRKPIAAAQPGSLWLEMEDALQAAIPTPVRQIILGIRQQSEHFALA